jgi:hypothetical protein
VSDPDVVGAAAAPFWWEELGSVVVGVEADLPGGVVDDAVVLAAEQHQVRE